MSHAYVIEIEHAAVGLIVREAEGYRFYATKHSTISLQQNMFETTHQAYQAVLDLHGPSIANRSSVTPLHSRVVEK
jgi:hypothetical protein